MGTVHNRWPCQTALCLLTLSSHPSHVRNACCPHLHGALLQGTKACLGWDREPQGGSHACTAVVDLWLQLLQLALHLSHNLPKGPADPLARQASLTDAMEPALDIRSHVAQLVKSYQASLQELMTQLLVHWKVKTPS